MSSRPAKRRRQVHSHSASPSPSTEDHDSAYSPASGSIAKATSRSAGGKTLSREQLRKANHSLIEKRRREKMNAALGDLREMVPGLSGASAGEFKLEVLERTVAYMQSLLQRIDNLEADLAAVGKSADGSRARKKRKAEETVESRYIDTPSPPSPSLSPPSQNAHRLHRERAHRLGRDPDETESDPGLRGTLERSVSGTSSTLSPPARTRAHPPYPMFAPPPPPLTQPLPPPARVNPYIHLPFPTPSPTSPFLTYQSSSRSLASIPSNSSATSTSSSMTGPPEPSPFMAPLPHIPLFGGALNLDATPVLPAALNSKREAVNPNMPAEEAANLLLAFSSPDTLRPITGPGHGFTSMQKETTGEGRKRSESGSDEWSLDGPAPERTSVHLSGLQDIAATGARVVGKTARDILMM